MAATISERNISRSGEISTRQELNYTVENTNDITEVETIVLATAPVVFNGLIREAPEYEPIGDDDTWYVSVKYRPPRDLRTPPEAGSARFHFNVAGEEQKVTHPISVVSRYRPDAGTAVAYEGIGDDGEELAGTSIIFPKLSFGYEFTIPGIDVTTAYIQVAKAIVGKVNDDTWKGFAAGEVLCTGINGAYEIGSDSTINFEFIASENVASFTIGGVAVSDPKKGWEYADVHSERIVDQGVLRLKIAQVDIMKVYEEADFDLLGIP